VHTPPIGVCTNGHDDGRGAWEPPHARGPTAGGPARQSEMISSSQHRLPEQPLLCGADPTPAQLPQRAPHNPFQT